MKNSVIALALLLGFGGLMACAGDDEEEESSVDTTGADAIVALEGDATSGEALYSNCSSCHGVDGTGGIGPDLHGEVAEYSDLELAGIIRNGYGSEMPSFEATLSDQEIADIIAYLNDAFGS